MLFSSREREFIGGSRNAVPESQLCKREIFKSRISIKAAILAGIAAVFSMSPCDAEAEPKKAKGSKPAVADQLSRTAASGVFIVVPSEANPEGNVLHGDSLKGFVDDPDTNWCGDCMIRIRCKEPMVVAPSGLTVKRGKDILVGPVKELHGRDISVKCVDDANPRKIEVPLPAPLQRVAAGVLLGAMKGQAVAAHEEAQAVESREPKRGNGNAAAPRQDTRSDEGRGLGQEQVAAGPVQNASSDVAEEDGRQSVGTAGAQAEPQEQGLFSENRSLVAEVGGVVPIVSGGDFFDRPLSSVGAYIAFGRELKNGAGDLRGTLRLRQISQGITEQDDGFRPVDPERRLSGIAVDCRLGANIKRRIAQTGSVRVDFGMPVGAGWSFMHVGGASDAVVGKQPPFEYANVPVLNTGAIGVEACPGIAVGIGDRVKAVLRVCGSMLAPVQKRAGDETVDMMFSVDGEAGIGRNF